MLRLKSECSVKNIINTFTETSLINDYTAINNIHYYKACIVQMLFFPQYSKR